MSQFNVCLALVLLLPLSSAAEAIDCGHGMTVDYVGSTMDSKVEHISGSWEDGCKQCGQYLESSKQICSGWYCAKDTFSTGIWLKRDPDQTFCNLGCPAYRQSTTCDWTSDYACPPGHGAKGQASDDGSQGWNCCCSCSGSIDTAQDTMQKAFDALTAAIKSCATFSQACQEDVTRIGDAINKAALFTKTSAFVCVHQGQTCINDAAGVVDQMLKIKPQVDKAMEHCVHGDIKAKWWCPGDLMNLVHTGQAIQNGIAATKYDCGFGGKKPGKARNFTSTLSYANHSSALHTLHV